MIAGSVVAGGSIVLIRIRVKICPGSGSRRSSGEEEIAKPLTTTCPCGSSSSPGDPSVGGRRRNGGISPQPTSGCSGG
jgi:hypothetical protein